MKRPPKVALTLDSHSDRVGAIVVEHRSRLATITQEFDRAVQDARLRASEKRREENARYRRELEEVRAA